MQGDNDSIIDLDAKARPTVLAGLFGCSPTLLYQDVDAGKLPGAIGDYTYREHIQFSRKYLIKNESIKLAKLEADTAIKEEKLQKDLQFKETKLRAKEKLEQDARDRKEEGGFGGDDGMPPLMAAKVKQEIRLGVAKEQQLWIKSSIERGEYIALSELVELCEPIIMTMKQSLLTIALGSDEAQKQVDLLMESLHKLGINMIDQADMDADNFITAIMGNELDYTEIDLDTIAEPVL